MISAADAFATRVSGLDAAMTSVLPLDCPIPWTMTQERSIFRDYPLYYTVDQSLQQRVVHIYLEYLWLPESLMPLRLLVPTLLHLVPYPKETTEPHPLHALLEPLLHTVRSCATKYRADLPALLAAAGAEPPEAEESMIWLALQNEPSLQAASESSQGQDPESAETARTQWLARMEHKEVQIQILLYLLKLSLPGPVERPTSPKKKRGRARSPPPPPPEQRLESFMDKLTMWQLVPSDASVLNTRQTEELDWVQRFCAKVVEPIFAQLLPDQCALLRSKVFPHSVFSEDERANASDNDPVVISIAAKKKRSRTASIADSSRARSLSVSLAEERRTLARSGSAGAGKRMFSREVSMSRVFKEREPSAPPTKDGASSQRTKRNPEEDRQRRKADETRTREGKTLVKATPAKELRVGLELGSEIGDDTDDSDDDKYVDNITLVEATPTKNKVR